MSFITDTKVERKKNAQVKIEGEIPYEELQKERPAALQHLGKDIEVDGFRKGNVPEKVLVERIGEMRILSEQAERALAKVYPQILNEHKIDAIGHPQVEITKLAPENPLGFTATVAVMPEITLPEYKALAKAVNAEKTTPEVTDEEVETQIKDIMRQKAAYERLQNKAAENADNPEEATDATDLPTPESEAAKAEEEKEPDLNELTDEYVKTLGQPGQFESVADFKSKLREHLETQKKQEVEAAHRAKITDTIIEQAEMELPEVMIESELQQMFAQMNEDLKRANLSMENYLEHIKKSQEDLKQEWRPAAEKRAKLQLILNEIAKEENITPDTDELNSQVQQLLEQYKDADEMRVRVYVASILTNEKVMQMLEAQ